MWHEQKQALIVVRPTLLQLHTKDGRILCSVIYSYSSEASKQQAYDQLIREARHQGYVVVAEDVVP